MRYAIFVFGLVLLVLLTGPSHSSGGGPQEVIVKLAPMGFVGGALPLADCPSVVAWVGATAAQLADVHCKALHGQAQTYRLRWRTVAPALLQHWLNTQQQTERLVWFEFSGPGLTTQAITRSSTFDFYERLNEAPRDAGTPSFVSDNTLRLQNLLRIYKPTGLVTIAIVDSGVNFDTERLTPLRYQNSAELPNNGIDDDSNGYIDDVAGWDFVDDGVYSWFDDTQTPDNDPQDLLGHGTAVAHIAAATGGPDAVSWLRILPLRVASGTSGVGSVSPFALAEAIHYAASMRVQIINLSVGSVQRYRVVTDAINAALEQGVQVVVAAGNSSGSVLFPADLPGVLAIGALDASGQIWSGSARGSGVSVFLRGTDMLRELSGDIFDLSPNGTSYAAPVAAGMIAMVSAVAGDCTLTTQTIREFRPADQRADTWAAALVNQYESEAQGLGNLAERWEVGQGVCGANLTVAALLRVAGH
jgi:hypothetical protein